MTPTGVSGIEDALAGLAEHAHENLGTEIVLGGALHHRSVASGYLPLTG